MVFSNDKFSINEFNYLLIDISSNNNCNYSTQQACDPKTCPFSAFRLFYAHFFNIR